MRILRIALIGLLLPFAWISAFRCRKQSFANRYQRLQAWCQRVIRICHIQFEVILQEELPQDVPLFFVANHQGTADPLFIVAGISTPMTFVSKVENKKIPVLSSWSKNIELIYFDRKDSNSAVHMLRESARYLKRKQNLLIFPEGTRSKGQTMFPFKNGALKPAYLGKACIVPIAQINSYAMWDAMKTGGTIRMVIGKPLPIDAYRSMDMDTLSNYIQTEIQGYIDTYQV